jgi:glycosyltransferase involved in cell wall biosynthesis
MPTVTVIIPTYNRCNPLVQAINSVLAQSYKDFELLVIDDGSTDNTRQVISAISDSRIKYIYKDNGGVSSARNAGIAQANGKYIAFLDSDDFWPENYLFTMVNSLRNNPDCGLAYCLTSSKGSDGIIRDYDSPERCHSGSITQNLFVNSVIWSSAAVLKKSLCDGIYFDIQLKNSEDSDFFLRLSTKTKCIFVDGIRAIRTSSSDSLSNSAGINCSRFLVLERFYFNLDGDKFVSKNAAFRKLSKACRKVAEKHRKNDNKNAALYLYGKAIKYWPTDFRLYWGLLKASLIKKDNLPGWQMPSPLGMPLCHLLQ